MELVFNFNPGAYDTATEHNTQLGAGDIFEVLVLAWQKKCKGVYYTRTVKDTNISDKSTCTSCAN